MWNSRGWARWSPALVTLLLASAAIGLAACGGGGGSQDAGGDSSPDSAVVDTGSGGCTVDGDCDDGLFCNGAERCAPDDPLADAMGCVPAATPCVAGQTCDEDAARCLTMCDLSGDADGDGHDSVDCGGDDCDDADDNAYPGNAEICDASGHDEDCDPSTLGGRDWDGDGVVDLACCNTQADGALLCGQDCDDLVRNVHPGASEVCDHRDNDCDGLVDEDVSADGWADLDGDLHGDPDAPLTACAGEAGFSLVSDDCDDTDNRVHGGQLEVCDGLDNDCNGLADDGTSSVTWYRDADGDGFGDPRGDTLTSCGAPGGFSLLPLDCDDSNADVNPSAVEICDGLDDNCDGLANFVNAAGDWEDDDHDGAPDCADAGADRDCDDRDPRVHPGATEVDDGLDNDCDGVVDGACTPSDWYPDADGDGWGDGMMAPTRACVGPAGMVRRVGDCDDGDVTRSPSEVEACDGVDNDCDGAVDEGVNTSCSAPHVLGVCDMGVCTQPVCELGYGDCSDVRAGCESYLPTDPANCGSCGTVCFGVAHGDPSCVDGACGFACQPGYDDCDGDSSNGCEVALSSDPMNCGACDARCSDRPHASASCTDVAGTPTCGMSCDAGWADCDGDVFNGCEVDLNADPANCGSCGGTCSVVGDACVAGRCLAPAFPSDGSEGEFAPTADTVLSAGVHNFTTITIPAGVTVTTNGDGILDLRATGDIVVDGIIDLSGGRGGAAAASGGAQTNGGGGGGATGRPTTGQPGTTAACGARGVGGTGAAGGTGAGRCGAGGANGGGVGGGFNGAGGGGGGWAGGGGGGANAGAGGAGASVSGSSTGGRGGTAGTPPDGGEFALGNVYSGGRGQLARSGGGGSIGADAAADLAVSTTFRPGSGGGGGGSQWADKTGGGGGGGGGALRLSSATRVVVAGELRANGGAGRCAPNNGGCGGSGSGGVIYVAAPSLDISGRVSAGAGPIMAAPIYGQGGLGRVRFSVLPSRCSLLGNYNPPLVDGCNPTPTPTEGATYIGVWPD